MLNFYKILFLMLLIFSTFITISALSWISAWIGLEMNLLALIPLMKTSSNKLSAEAAIKYFIIQAMASTCLLFSMILFSNLSTMEFKTSISMIMMNTALILKMGAAPLHFWLPEVISGLGWNLTIIILTWQKIAPMILLSYSLFSVKFTSIISITSTLTGSIQGLNQTCLRKLMTFSSINHMGWMMATFLSSLNLWFYYFLTYTMMNINIILLFKKFNLYFISQLNKLIPYNSMIKFLLMMNLLSLGGLPPFIGFLPKWLTINFLINSSLIMLSFIMIIMTLMALYFYTRITFFAFTLNNSESLTSPPHFKFSFWSNFINFWTLSSLPLHFFLSSTM
uniref:NADH-ubiquinone oxidoreductase chain 2 n=1 Tax=Trigonopterus carinirostris TaxID=2576104 RepID=A0A7H1KI05_9CUCU|nr:NADH dehydrogenase subunit 2 [Trigonopterus carinirostris]QNT26921.1 NADH dehydrogenase subunit 2 [Trigonopterus carinirostris]